MPRHVPVELRLLSWLLPNETSRSLV